MLFRFLAILLAIILIVPVLRSIIGIVLRGFADLVKTADTKTDTHKPAVPVQAANELKKDPVCGTYVSTATALKKRSGAETLYFCSQACLQRHKV